MSEFQPFIWNLVSRSVPSPIFAVSFTGVARWLRVDAPDVRVEDSLEVQIPLVKQAILDNPGRGKTSPFGLLIGHVFIRGEGDYHEFDLEGNYVGPFEKRIPHINAVATFRV